MCITLHASALSSTKIYAGEAHRNGTYVHVLAYQNNAHNMAPGPNAMVLPIPSVKEMGPENAIDTRSFKGFLSDIAEATKELTLGDSRGLSRGLRRGLPQVFDVGSYSVVLGTKMGAAMAALEQVPANKRPKLNPEVLASLAGNYPGWAFAICCWDGQIQAEPLLWWYEPKVPKVLFAPGLDAHDGKPPAEGSNVFVDTIITFGSTLKPTGEVPVRYRSQIPADVGGLLPTRAVGQKLQERMPNGDYWYRTENFDGHSEFSAGWAPKPALRAFPGMNKPGTVLHLGHWS